MHTRRHHRPPHPNRPARDGGRLALLGATWTAGLAAALFMIVASADEPAPPAEAIAPVHVALTIGR